MMRRRLRKGMFVAAGAALAGLGVARWRGAFRTVVEGHSMAPTLLPGQFLVATRPRAVHRGDVVVVRLPRRGIEAVKRVVGMPGERVRVVEGRAEVDGRKLEEPHARGTGVSGEWSLTEGEYLVLGDDRGESTDGRTFGPVPRETIVGVVRFRYWPRAGSVR
jgi:signal peptidase I